MGSCCTSCRRSTTVVHTSIEAPVAGEIFWATRFDVEQLPQLTRNVASVELLAGDTNETTKAGLKWRERRIYKGRSLENIMTVTRVETNCPDGALYCAHYSVCFDQESWERVEANQTGTLSVYPIDDTAATACRVVFTVIFVVEGCMAAIFFKLVGWCARRYAVVYITEELQEIAAAAVARQANGIVAPSSAQAVSDYSSAVVVSD